MPLFRSPESGGYEPALRIIVSVIPGLEAGRAGVRQIRGEAGRRQVDGAELCLVTGRGMVLNTSSALILGK